MKSKMIEIIVDGGSLNINSGFVKLSDKQAKPRLHNLKQTKEKGVYEVLSSIQFKNGEVLSTDQEQPKKDKAKQKAKSK